MLRRTPPRRSFILWTCLAASLTGNFYSYISPSSNAALSSNNLIDPAPNTSHETCINSPYPLFPRRIWQIAADTDIAASNALGNSWHILNPSWRYELLSDEQASTFVNETFGATRPDIVDVYHRIETPILRVDLLRYLILFRFGGLYADIDVDCKITIDEWLSPEMRQTTGLILGIEYDDVVHDDMPGVSLAQYVFLARPGHPVLEAVIAEAITRLQTLGDRAPPSGVPRPNTNIISASTPQQVLETTGPYMFARIVFDYLETASEFKNPAQLHHIQVPVQFGDVIILPINGFGWGQEHSRSGELDMGERLVVHHFRRGWREPRTWGLDFSWREKPIWDD